MILVSLCGLPGSGKSSLCARLAKYDATALNLIWVEMDEAQGGAEWDGESTAVLVDAATGQSYREARLAVIRDRVEQAKAAEAAAVARGRGEEASPTLLMLDDTAHLSSMRHDAYVIARDAQVSFAVLYCRCPVDVALCRNARRSGKARVRDPVMRHISSVFEEPRPKGQPHDRFVTVVDTGDEGARGTVGVSSEEAGGAPLDSRDLPSVVTALEQMVQCALLEPPHTRVQHAKDCAQSQASRDISAGSLLHQLDLRTRQVMRTVMCASPLHHDARLLSRQRRDLIESSRSRVHASSDVDKIVEEFLTLIEDAKK